MEVEYVFIPLNSQQHLENLLFLQNFWDSRVPVRLHLGEG